MLTAIHKYNGRRTWLALLVILLAGCSSRTSQPAFTGDTESLAGLQSLSTTKKTRSQKATAMNKIREMALQETGLSVGAQSGLAWRSKYIDDELTKQARNLDAIYDFNALILENDVLPPVLLEGRKMLNLADTQTIRISDRTYKVSKQARFVTSAPNWRQYLWMDYRPPETPHISMLPKTHEESVLWRAYVARGWENGIEQANIILEESIARIKEDFSGMILYRKLLAMNMVSPPYVSHTDLGVTGDADEMHIDDRVLRITALPALNVNSSEWRAAVAQDEHILEKFTSMAKRIDTAKIVMNNKTWQPIILPQGDPARDQEMH